MSGRPPVAVGTRIRLIAMPSDPDPIPEGATGTVTGGNSYPGLAQVWVEWDAPHERRSLNLIPDVDRWQVIPDPNSPFAIVERAERAFRGQDDTDPWEVVSDIVADVLDSVDLALANALDTLDDAEDVDAWRRDIIATARDYYESHYG